MHSAEVEAAIQSAMLDSMRRRRTKLTVEALLFALLDMSAACEVLLACWVDLESIRTELESALEVPGSPPAGFFKSLFDVNTTLIRPMKTLVLGTKRLQPELNDELSRILEKAQHVARNCGRDLASSAEVLLAICDAEETAAAKLLRKFGASRFPVAEYVLGRQWDAATPPPVQEGFSHVFLLDDPITPMEVVVQLLETVFEFPRARAINLMLRVHKNGQGSCGVFPTDVAKAKMVLAMESAEEKGHFPCMHCG
ncbi:MAG: ATP-dependent Clp protease adaptor ClpS [Massilia sp.]